MDWWDEAEENSKESFKVDFIVNIDPEHYRNELAVLIADNDEIMERYYEHCRNELAVLIADNDEIMERYYKYISMMKENHKEIERLTKGKWKHIKIKDQSDEIEGHKALFEDTLNNNRKKAKITTSGNLIRSLLQYEYPIYLRIGLAVGYAIKGLIEGSNIPEAIKELKSAKEVLIKFQEMDGIKEEIEAIEGLLELFKLKRYAEWIPFLVVGHVYCLLPSQAYGYAKRITTKEINEKSFKRFYEARNIYEKPFRQFYINFSNQIYATLKSED